MASLVAITGVLGTDRAAHLLRRLTFGATRKEIDSFATKTITEALGILLAPQPVPAPPVDSATGLPWVVPGPDNSYESNLANMVRYWFYGQMYNAGTTSTEKLTFFLHTNFTGIISLSQSTSVYFQNQLLRQFVFGNFKKLALKICMDNAMLSMLDNRLNENLAPNENYAREFFELFTIGKGPEIAAGNYTTYTEEDVRAAAKVLSGWDTDPTYSTIDSETGLPTGKLKLNTSLLATKHDASIKTFSSAFNNTVIQPSAVVNSGGDDVATAAAAQQELSDLVDMIFAQKATARNICRKIYRFFVYYIITDEVEANIIGPMADLFYSGNYELKPVLELLFQSQHFFDADDSNALNDTRGAIIKSPLEITIGMMRYLNVAFPDMYTSYTSFYELAGMVIGRMGEQGFDLYNPLDVSGYDAYFQAPEYNRNWISPNYLARRYQFAILLLTGIVTKDGTASLSVDSIAWLKDPSNISDPSDATKVTSELIHYLFPEPITTDRFNLFFNILVDNLPAYEWTKEWNDYLSSGTNESGVRNQINNLLSALLQSAEYQLS